MNEPKVRYFYIFRSLGLFLTTWEHAFRVGVVVGDVMLGVGWNPFTWKPIVHHVSYERFGRRVEESALAFSIVGINYARRSKIQST